MEKILLSASVKSRDSFNLIRNYIQPTRYSKEFQILFDRISEYYSVDRDAKFAQREAIIATLMDKVKAEKHVQRITEMLDLALAESVDVSEANVKHIVLQAKRQEVGDELAVALTSGKPTDDLLREYQGLLNASELEDVSEQGIEVYTSADLMGIINRSLAHEGQMKVYPQSLGEKLDGGMNPGHHMVVYALTEVGKSVQAITMSAGFARHGHKVLYWENEDTPQDTLLRLTSCFTGRTKYQIWEDPQGSYEMALERGMGNVTVVSAAPGNFRQIESYIEKTEPRALILNQLRNIDTGKEARGNKVVQLEQSATFARNMSKKWQLATVSITQAGDSARGRAVLDSGDVDFSNVGIPGQADILLGIGMTKENEADNTRVFTLAKNKLSGNHDSFPVRIIPQLSRFESI